MKKAHRRCAGLDVHKQSVSACARMSCGRQVESARRVFGTFTADLRRLGEWLKQNRIRE